MSNKVLSASIDIWKSKLTEEEIKSLKKYTTDEHRKINKSLMNREKLHELVEIIDSALKKFELPEDVTVHRSQRGINNEDENIPIEEVCDAYSVLLNLDYKQYVSTSLKKECALNFLSGLRYEDKENNKSSKYLLLEGNVRKGMNCGILLDEDLSEIPEENELLIFRNIHFNIKKTEIFLEDTIRLVGTFERS